MSLIEEVLKMAENDDTFRGTQIVSYMIGYIEGSNPNRDEAHDKMLQLTKLIREVNIYDSLQ